MVHPLVGSLLSGNRTYSFDPICIINLSCGQAQPKVPRSYIQLCTQQKRHSPGETLGLHGRRLRLRRRHRRPIPIIYLASLLYGDLRVCAKFANPKATVAQRETFVTLRIGAG